MLPRPFPFTSLPEISTKRLLLRALTENDLTAYHALCAEEKTMRYYGLKHHTSLEQTRKVLDILNTWFEANTAIRWGIFCDDLLIGDIGFWQFDVLRNRAEVGAKISMSCQRQGIGYEALVAVIDFGFCILKLSGIDGNVAQSNKASLALVEKIGFYKVGVRLQLSYSIFEERWQDMILFSLNKQDWNKK